MPSSQSAATTTNSSDTTTAATTTSSSRGGSRSRSGESSRSRSRSGRRRHSSRRHRRHRRGYPKIPERNFVGAACSMFAIVGTCTALAKSECFVFKGGSCQDGNGVYLTSMAIKNFFSTGNFINSTTYQFGSFGKPHHLINCVDPELVSIFKSILALILLSMFCSLAAFVLDIIGPKQRHIMLIRRNGMLNISAVFLLVTVCGMCYWAALLLYQNLHNYKRAKGSKVIVDFGISYYILVSAAVSNIVATACNLLRRYPPAQLPTDTQPILNDVDQAILRDEASVPQSVMVREPPPYAP